MFYYQRTIVIVNIIFPLLAILAVLARVSARRLTKLSLGADDWLIIVSLILDVAAAIYTVAAVYTFSYGNIVIFVPQQDIFKFLYVDRILLDPELGLIKCSVILFYKRIFTTRTFSRVANVVLLICAARVIVTALVAIFHTTPISLYWDENGITSLDIGAYTISMCAIDLTLDLIILSLPIPMIRRLQISLKKRLAVLGVFGLGMFCLVTISVRIGYFVMANPALINPPYIAQHPEQATGKISHPIPTNIVLISIVIQDASIMWVHIECSASIITACLPTLVPVFSKMKTIASSLGSSWTLFTRSKTSISTASDVSLAMKQFKSSESRENSNSQEFEGGKISGQIQTTTVISVT